MKRSHLWFIPACMILALLQILLAACGTPAQTAAAGGTTSGNAGGSSAAQVSLGSSLGSNHKKKPQVTIKIGLNLPLSGTDADQGISAEDGALLALSQAKIPGYTLQLVAKNDANASGTPDATIAANNMKALNKDAQVAGIIGAFDTPTAEAELPLANQASIALISPSATFSCLTQASASCGTLLSTVRPTGKTTFFRLQPSDIQQGNALANFLYTQRFVRKVYVIDDTSAYGVALAGGFIGQFQANGGVVVGHASTGVTASYINLLTQIAAIQPDLIFYAGGDVEGKTLRQQKFQIPGLKRVEFAGGNGIHTANFASQPAYQGDFVYSSSPSFSLTTGTFVQQYQAKYGTPGTYSVAGYDSANILIAAIKVALSKGTKPATNGNQTTIGLKFRLTIIHFVAQTKLASVSGVVQYAFAPDGNPLSNAVQIDELSMTGGTASQWMKVADENVA